MWQETTYGAGSSQGGQYGYNPPGAQQAQAAQPFYAPGPGVDFYPGARPSLDGVGSAIPQGSINANAPAYGGNIQPGAWWTAFGTGGFDGEPPLLEELGINFSHIRNKSLAVLNPLRAVDANIMDDADLAGPLVFCFFLATFLLLSGKAQFGYIYGVGLFGAASIYTLLNLMSQQAIDAYRVASVLGYSLLPMVGVAALSVFVKSDQAIGFLAILSTLWCTYAASGIFVAVLRMSDQRLLVAYPVGLLYGCFALLSVFRSETVKL